MAAVLLVPPLRAAPSGRGDRSDRRTGTVLSGGRPVRQTGTAPSGGRLVLIQIDGLSLPQARRAMDEGRMPFLAKLERERGYVLRTLYSGLPASTAAMQAELFYGVKTAVPAYSFKTRADTAVKMTDWEAARRVEKALAKRGKPLLKGGSVYSSIYTGGAAESYFCAMSVRRGLDKPVFFARWLFGFLLRRPWEAAQVLARTFWEFVPGTLAVADGFFKGYEVGQEAYFIFKRVACVWLKEISTLGARRDMARGVPVIYVNFVGYDEAAHRRGPSTIYARRFLKGIDRKIKTLYSAAEKRGYEVWVLSDHGQEDAVPYVQVRREPFPEAVRDAVQPHLRREEEGAPPPELFFIDMKEWTINFFGFGHLMLKEADLWVISMGPLAHVYLPEGLSAAAVDALARDVVRKTGAPMALTTDGPGKALVYLADGRYVMPEDAEAVLGAHPFREEAARDLVALAHHPDAGRLVLCGWHGGTPLTLALEHGAHGGVGPNETSAFTLLPASVRLDGERGYHRPLDLRRAVFRFLES
jgi:hypothetical protein